MRHPDFRCLFVIGSLLFFFLGHSQDKRFEPNDYGTTALLVENKGFDVALDYLDFLGLPKAWYYTTGRRDIAVGISDGSMDTTQVDFKGKTKVVRPSSLAKGHGIGVAGVAAAQGDNGFGIPGVCYDCSIYATSFGDFAQFRQLKELSEMGVKVINCSYVSKKLYPTAQESINEMFRKGTIIVAGAGNNSWQETQGEWVYYPASYDHVISVSSGMYKHPTPKDNLQYDSNGNPYVENIRGFVSRTAGFTDNDLNKPMVSYHVSTATLNEHVDLLAPTVGVVRYGKYVLEDEIEIMSYQGTSTAAPFVTGTIGLMFSLYPCLPVDEVESILKITALNIDHIEANNPYRGKYGAGMLQTGDAVEMVYQLYNENETAIIDNQNFSRWNFKITALSKEVVIQEQEFTDAAQFQLTAKHQVVLKPNTLLRPNSEGRIVIGIDPGLERQCDFQFRDPSVMNVD